MELPDPIPGAPLLVLASCKKMEALEVQGSLTAAVMGQLGRAGAACWVAGGRAAGHVSWQIACILQQLLHNQQISVKDLAFDEQTFSNGNTFQFVTNCNCCVRALPISSWHCYCPVGLA